jgi:hypothetical protein
VSDVGIGSNQGFLGDPRVEPVEPFSPDAYGADGLVSGEPGPTIVVVRGKRIPRPGGGGTIPIMLQIATPPEHMQVATLLGAEPESLCSTTPNSGGRLIVVTFNPDGSGHYIAPPNFSMLQMLQNGRRTQDEYMARVAAASNSVDPAAGALTAIVYVLSEFAAWVGRNKPYDWKHTGVGGDLRVPLVNKPEEMVRIYEPFGNWAYGYFGAAIGINDSVLRLGADVANRWDNNGAPDEERDVANINAGIAAFKADHARATSTQTGQVPPTAFIIQC